MVSHLYAEQQAGLFWRSWRAIWFYVGMFFCGVHGWVYGRKVWVKVGQLTVRNVLVRSTRGDLLGLPELLGISIFLTKVTFCAFLNAINRIKIK